MRPKCQFVEDLNQDIAILDQINFTSIWTPLDAMIVPASSSHLPAGQEVILNDDAACAGDSTCSGRGKGTCWCL